MGHLWLFSFRVCWQLRACFKYHCAWGIRYNTSFVSRLLRTVGIAFSIAFGARLAGCKGSNTSTGDDI